jgi:hypothetical protein
MANPSHPDDPYRSPLAGDDVRRQARLDNELQPDPELAEGPASGGRIAVFAVAIAVIVGVVFYGLNNSPIHQAGTSSTAQNTAPASSPAAPAGMRDVTPHSNTQPGTTTGAAPVKPKSLNPEAPPATANPGATSSGATNSGSPK